MRAAGILRVVETRYIYSGFKHIIEIDEQEINELPPVLSIRFHFRKKRIAPQHYKMDNAKQQCIKVNILTDEAPFIINLSVSGYTLTGSIIHLKPSN